MEVSSESRSKRREFRPPAHSPAAWSRYGLTMEAFPAAQRTAPRFLPTLTGAVRIRMHCFGPGWSNRSQ